MMQRNPFSTRFIRPGEVRFVFPAGYSQQSVLASLQNPSAQGAIVGPHGSGKSTLLEMLGQSWEEMGLVEQRVRLTASRKSGALTLGELDTNSILVIDGFEQLSLWKHWWIRWRCQHAGARLLVTTHQDCGLPIIVRTQPDWPLAYKLSAMLLDCDATPYEADLKAVWEEDPGDIRAYFFRLYHWCELHGIYQLSRPQADRKGLSVSPGTPDR